MTTREIHVAMQQRETEASFVYIITVNVNETLLTELLT